MGNKDTGILKYEFVAIFVCKIRFFSRAKPGTSDRICIFLSFTKVYWFFIFINYLIRFCLNLHYLEKEEMDFHSFTQFAHCEKVSAFLDPETMENDQN